MKKCPTCDKEFEDSMRFCQVDGTLLVDDAPAFDPYATIVAKPFPIEPVNPPVAEPPAEVPEAEPEIHYTVGSIPIAEPDDVLDLPTNDPLKTMYVSDSEMQATLKKEEPTADFIDIPPVEETSQPTPPSFISPESPAPPPSPFSASESVSETPAPMSYEVPEPEPVLETEQSSPFDTPFAASPVYSEPAAPSFDEAATMMQPSFNSPFEMPPAPVAEWTPPPAPDASWQKEEIGSNTPFQPPPAGVEGQNKTLPIISLVLGIISLCCYVSPLTGLAALVTGFLGMKNANNDPANYGGKGLAIAGMVTGGLFFLIGIIYWVFILFFGGLAMIMDAAR